MNKLEKFANSLQIPLTGNDYTDFFCKCCKIPLASGYERIVVGERGPYIEFKRYQLNVENIYFPVNQFHKYFDEYRSVCGESIFVYFQRQKVAYADYKIGFYYISPDCLKTSEIDRLVCNSAEPQKIF